MISVSEWVPSYGDPHQLEDEQEYARVWEHEHLRAVDTPPCVRPRVAFVDGVRRAEALLYLDQVTAVAGVLAAGAAVPGGGYAGVRVERVFLRAAEIRLPPQSGGWSWRSLLIPPDLNAELALQRAMRELEAEVGLTEGNIFQGELTFDQLLFNRPVPGYANYRTPVRDLWICGSSTHPGGGVMGAPGRNAAAEILRDAKLSPKDMSDAWPVL